MSRPKNDPRSYYKWLMSYWSGDRVKCLRQFFKIYPHVDPVSVLGEDVDCVHAARDN